MDFDPCGLFCVSRALRNGLKRSGGCDKLEKTGRDPPPGRKAEEMDILERDRQDSSRAAAPLKPAPDAILLDTTGNEFEESVRQILEIIKGRL